VKLLGLVRLSQEARHGHVVELLDRRAPPLDVLRADDGERVVGVNDVDDVEFAGTSVVAGSNP
jgi:hypothetical protein